MSWARLENLARRIEPETRNRKANAIPILGTCHRPHWNASSAGATPNEITSASESYTSPNEDSEPVRRAIRPSRMSAMIAIRISRAERSNWPRLDSTTDRNPQKMLPTVNSDGMM